ncbi:MAG: hypothetical protein NT090_03615 [Acidobacteria bacterium]|nr:hypothetical protein [Acidobacteriota bacterium]
MTADGKLVQVLSDLVGIFGENRSRCYLGHAGPRMTARSAHVVDMAKRNPALVIPAKVG